MSHFVRKPTICTSKNKDADQLRGNREADQCLYFRYWDSTIPLNTKFQASSLLTVTCTAWFVSDLVRIHIVGFLKFWLKCQVHHQPYTPSTRPLPSNLT